LSSLVAIDDDYYLKCCAHIFINYIRISEVKKNPRNNARRNSSESSSSDSLAEINVKKKDDSLNWLVNF
jgi:hypothetical protein